MPAELGRIDLGDVTPHNIKLLRKVNTVVFPVSYHDKFYKVIWVISRVFWTPSFSHQSPLHRMCLKLGSWQSWPTSTTLWLGLSAAGSTCRVLAGRLVSRFDKLNSLEVQLFMSRLFDMFSNPAVHNDTGVPGALPTTGNWHSDA